MKRILFTATALALSTAAAAQMPPPGPGWNGGPPPPGAGPEWHRGQGWDANAFWRGAPDSPRDRIQFLQDRINRGVADHSIYRYQAGRINGQLNDLRRWIQRMHWQDQGRLNPEQDARVQARLDQISQQIRWVSHKGW